MTSYTDTFGNDAIPPAGATYASISLTADTTFFWPDLAQGANLLADKMDITATNTWAMTLPAANTVSTGRDLLIRNVGANTITVHDAAGGTLATIAAGVVKLLYITDNSTAAGAWAVFTFGTGTSAADSSALAGYGLVATGSTLSQTDNVVSTATSYAVTSTNRAGAVEFTNSGVVTCSLPSAASLGNGFFVEISNQGTGTVTIDPNSTETIDGATTKDLAPGESLRAVCTGSGWFSVGYGRSTQFQFTKLVLDISAGSPFTLTSTQAQNKLIQTIGTITGAVTINVPAVVAVYYIECSHTGAFTTTFKTAAGSGVALSAGDRSILYCDGVNVVSAQTASVPAANLSGGVAGSLVYQTGVGTTGFTAAGVAGQVVLSGGAGAPTFSDLGLITDGYSSKATPVDADELPLSDSAAAFGPKKLTIANLKMFLNTLYAALTGGNTFTGTQTIQAAATQDAVKLAGRAGGTGSYSVTITPTTLGGNRTATLPDANTTIPIFSQVITFSGPTAARAVTLPDSNTSIPIFSQTITFSGPTAARTVTLPDAAFTVAGLGIAQAFSAGQRGAVTTANTASYDMNAGNNFSTTLAAGQTLAFTNITAGQSGNIYFSNGSNYAVAKNSYVKCSATMLTTISATGTYLLTYYSPDGTNVYVTNSGALS